MVGQGGTRRRPSLPVPVCRPHTPMMMMMMVTRMMTWMVLRMMLMLMMLSALRMSISYLNHDVQVDQDNNYEIINTVARVFCAI